MSFLLGENPADDSCGIAYEGECYLKERSLLPDQNALEWWSKNEDHYPTLANLAKQNLTVPATSVPSERIFPLLDSL